MKRSLFIILIMMIIIQVVHSEEVDIDLIKVPNYITDESDIQLYKVRKQKLDNLKSKYMKMTKEERSNIEKQSLMFQRWENDLKRKYQHRKRAEDL